MRPRRRGTPWGCLVVVQFTSTEVPQWKSESLFGAGMEVKFRGLLVISICCYSYRDVEWPWLARSGDVFVT